MRPSGIRIDLDVVTARGAFRSRGFSLVELMVALVIAAIVLLGLAAYFVSSSRNFSETERVSRQIENGRYAAALLSEEVRHAGFYGEVGNVRSEERRVGKGWRGGGR